MHYLCSVKKNEYIENGILVQEIDARDLSTGLVRSAELIDRHRPFIIILTYYDELLSTDHALNYHLLGQLIGVQIGLPQEKQKLLTTAETGFRHIHVAYGQDLEDSISRLIDIIAKEKLQGQLSKRYIAIRLLEGSDEVLSILQQSERLRKAVVQQQETIRRTTGKNAKELILFAREGFIHGALEETLKHAPNDTEHPFSDKLDKILTNRWFGFPILIILLYIVFEFTFTLGAYPQEWIATGIDYICGWLSDLLPAGWLTSLFVDGIVQGVGAVLAFLPNIIILFFFLSLMEDSGYMARAAYLMDKIMHKVGLHGRSFIPMLVGFGCNVPAIMAARNIENRKDRTLTMLMIPFMSCSARLPVYMLFIGAFFPNHKALMMMSLYGIGILLSILFALIMKHTKWFRSQKQDYVSSLPAFTLPTLKQIGLHIWERVADYLQKISTVILWASVIIWALTYFPTQEMETSYLAMIGQTLEPIVQPLGFDWKMAVCLLTGLPAKEAIVSTLGILFHGELVTTAVFTPLSAFSFMIFVLLYFPCVATIGTLRREAGWGWAWFTVFHSIALAWLMSFLIYQIGSWFC